MAQSHFNRSRGFAPKLKMNIDTVAGASKISSPTANNFDVGENYFAIILSSNPITKRFGKFHSLSRLYPKRDRVNLYTEGEGENSLERERQVIAIHIYSESQTALIFGKMGKCKFRGYSRNITQRIQQYSNYRGTSIFLLSLHVTGVYISVFIFVLRNRTSARV